MFQCKELYIDMEKELKDYEEKWNEKKKEKENETKNEEKIPSDKKKNVFANFKSYNKDAGNGRVNNVPLPKNNINTNRNTSQESDKIILKEKSNHYTCLGRFSNFNMLQPIHKKKLNKNYEINFAEFKKIQENKKIKENK